MSDVSKHTIIEDGTDVEGSINSKCDVTVSGRVKGAVVAPALTISQSGAVNGKVSVTDLKSMGEVSGNIEAKTAELAGVVGNDTVVRAGTLEVKLSDPQGKLQVSFGNCSLEVGQKFGFDAVESSEGSAVRNESVVKVEEKQRFL